MNNKLYIEISSKDLKDKCENSLKKIKELRAEKTLILIELTRTKMASRLLHKFFKRTKSYTDQEVKNYLGMNWITELYSDGKFPYSYNERLIRKLLKTCDLSDKLYIAVDDLNDVLLDNLN